jgi:hypothetical protein
MFRSIRNWAKGFIMWNIALGKFNLYDFKNILLLIIFVELKND